MGLKYRELADHLRRKISKNSTDTLRLPAERELAEQYQVSRQTIRKALEVLTEEGLIEKRQGSGSYAVQQPVKTETKIAVLLAASSSWQYSEAVREFLSVCAGRDCLVQVCLTGGSVSREREILQGLLVNRVDGICIEGTKSALPNPNLAIYQRLQQDGTALFFLQGRYQGMESAAASEPDGQAGGYQAVRYLADRNHSRIALFFSSDECQGRERYRGCINAMLDYGLSVKEDCCFWYDAFLREQFRQPHAPCLTEMAARMQETCTAAICQDEEMAYLLMRTMQELGIRMPKDFSVLCFEDESSGRGSSIRFTSVTCRGQQIGKAAADMMLELISGRKPAAVVPRWTIEDCGSVLKL